MNRADPRRLALVGLGLAVVAGSLLVWSCRSALPSRQGWDEGRFGPLVSHENFPGDCSLCHLPERWDVLREDFAFDHEKETGYALAGAHQMASCLRCHNDRGPVTQYLARGCGGCHVDIHTGTMPKACEDCHDQWSWRPQGEIAQHAKTRFPLFGSHAAVACDDCHVQARTGQFEGLSVACEHCHLGDALAATSINHGQLGWVTDCQRCHSPTTFGGDFQHNFWPLIGAHAQANCNDCHQGGQFANTPNDCYSCHQTDYQNALNPDHVAGNYPTACQICHNTVDWNQASFNHQSQFPLTGAHSGLNCTDCHVGNNYNTFSCLTCHDHSQSLMDPAHSGVKGYSYNSQACKTCHPNGKKN